MCHPLIPPLTELRMMLADSSLIQILRSTQKMTQCKYEKSKNYKLLGDLSSYKDAKLKET